MSRPIKKRLAILISGRGSNMQSIIKACNDPSFPAEVSVVLSNRADAAGLKFAKDNNIPTEILSHKEFASRNDYDTALNAVLERYQPDFICLAGFMRLLTPVFCTRWQGKAINIHPSLLPAFKGADAQKQALDYGVKITGCSTHYVTEEMDSGAIIAQKAVDVLPNDTVETLSNRILQQEHLLYPETLYKLCTDSLV